MNMLASSPKLVETMLGSAGDQLTEYTNQVLGATEPAARRAIRAVFTELVAELTHQSIRAGDAKRIFELVMAPNLYRDVVTNLNALLASERAAEPLLAHGSTLIEQIFGDRAKALRDAIAQEVGLGPAQAGQLLPLAVSVGIGTLKADFRRAQIDARQLKHMLDGQLSIAPAAAAVPPVLQPQPQPQMTAASDPPRAPERPPLPRFEAEPRRSPLPWILAAVTALVIALLGWLYVRHGAVAKPAPVVEERAAPAPLAAPAPAPAPAAPAPAPKVEPAAAAEPAVSDEPRRVRLTALRFELGSAAPVPEAREVLAQALRILDPSDAVIVEGHTDRSGDAARNQAIALARARSIAALLQQLGLERNRISVVGRSDEVPIGSNDTAEGRALNRRVELVITTK